MFAKWMLAAILVGAVGTGLTWAAPDELAPASTAPTSTTTSVPARSDFALWCWLTKPEDRAHPKLEAVCREVG